MNEIIQISEKALNREIRQEYEVERKMSRKTKKQKQSNQSQQMSTFHYLVLFVILFILNISFFIGYGGSNVLAVCSADSIIKVIALYLTNNGKINVRDLLPSQCTESGFSEKSVTELENSVRNLMINCRNYKQISTLSPPENGPLLTLFTTFADHLHSDSEKNLVHNNTLANWAVHKPYINLILFSNDTYWVNAAKNFGWDVIEPLQDENGGQNPPVLKDMFHLTMQRYHTLWYGYMNADILFTGDLIKNLEFLSEKYNLASARLLLTGRRTNVANLTNLDPLSGDSIRHHAELYGKLYREDAEDFFITTKSFPWQRILPLVVGRPGYDNWLVGEARCRLNTTVIDVTKTLLAFHQTTTKGGNSEGHLHPNSDFNYNVLKNNKIVPNYLAGLTDCIIFYTYSTFCDGIDISQRTSFGPACSCKYKAKKSGS